MWEERQPDSCAVGRHRRLGSGHEVVGVDDDRAGTPGVVDCGVQFVERLEADVFDAHVGPQRVEGCCDLLGAADEERVPGFGEEPPVGQDDLKEPVVRRLLQEHAAAMSLLAQPCEERRR